MGKKLNLGCGTDIREGWINLDRIALEGVDIVHDLTILPLPFKDEIFDEVICKDILEHVPNYIDLLKDIHRILIKGGKLTIQVPHFTSKNAYSDPTHCRFFSVQTFFYFTVDHMRSYYFDFHFSKILRVRINFDIRFFYFYNWLLERIVNSSITIQNFYEGSPLKIFPATNLVVVLSK